MIKFLSTKNLLRKKSTLTTLVMASVFVVVATLVAMPLIIFGEPSQLAATTAPPSPLGSINAGGLEPNFIDPDCNDLTPFQTVLFNNPQFINDTPDSTNPIIIYRADQLRGFACYVNNDILGRRGSNGQIFDGWFFALGDDINLGGDTVSWSSDSVSGTPSNVWTPIGNATNRFSGNFDGRGHSIINMTAIVIAEGTTDTQLDFGGMPTSDFMTYVNRWGINAFLFGPVSSDPDGIPTPPSPSPILDPSLRSEAHAGLFGYLHGGTISNINMTRPIAIAIQHAAVQTNGFVGGSGTLEGVPFGFAQAGSVVGRAFGTLENLSATDAVVISSSNNSFAGGIAGSINRYLGTPNLNNIDNMHATGVVIASDRAEYSNVPINLRSRDAGGIAGSFGTPITGVSIAVTNSSFEGEVLARQTGGGLVGSYWAQWAGGSSITFDNNTVEFDQLLVNNQGGGLIGTVWAQGVTISNNNISGNMGGSNTDSGVSQIGGIGGYVQALGLSATNNTVAGNISTNGQAGGFFAQTVPADIGSSMGLSISGSSYTGDILAGNLAGGLIAVAIGGNDSTTVNINDVTVAGSVNASTAGGAMGTGGGIGFSVNNFTQTSNITGGTGLVNSFGGSGGNFVITNSNFSGDVTGAGIASGFGGISDVVLENVHVSGSTGGSGGFGGFGGASNFIITDSSFSGNIGGNGVIDGFWAGNSIVLNGVNVSGNIGGSGFAGGFDTSGNLTINNSNFTGTLNGSFGFASGFWAGDDISLDGVTINVTGATNDISNTFASSFYAGRNLTIANSDFIGDVERAGFADSFEVVGSILLNNVNRTGNSGGAGFGDTFQIRAQEGNGFTIINSSFNGNMYGAGIANYFSLTSDNNPNITLDGVSVSGSARTGGIFRYFGGQRDIIIVNSNFTNTVTGPSASGLFRNVGGSNLVISNVTRTGSITATSGVATGAIGNYYGSSISVTNSTFSGDVTGVTGAFGFADSSGVANGLTLSGFTRSGNVTTESGRASGFMGDWGSSSAIVITDGSIIEGNITSEQGDARGFAYYVGAHGGIILTNFTRTGNVTAENGRASGFLTDFGGGAVNITNSTFGGNILSDGDAVGFGYSVGGFGGLNLSGVTKTGNVTAENGRAVGFVMNYTSTDPLNIINNSSFSGDISGSGFASRFMENFGIEGGINLNGVSMSGNVVSTSGTATGFAGSGATTSLISITDSEFEGDVRSGGGWAIGGLFTSLGNFSGITFDGLTWNGDIIATESNATHIGGLIGTFGLDNDLNILNTEFTGDILLSGSMTPGMGNMSSTGELTTVGGLVGAFGSGGNVNLDGVTRTGHIIAPTSGTVSPFLRAGGIFGMVHTSSIDASDINVTGNVIGGWTAGGFAGSIGASDSVSITGSEFRGNVAQVNTDLRDRTYRPIYPQAPNVGRVFGPTTEIIEHGHAGGVIGDIGSESIFSPLTDFSLTDVVSQGTVTGAQAGGLVGRTIYIDAFQTTHIGNVNAVTHAAGGLVGTALNANIEESFVMGDVTIENIGAAVRAGGLIGGSSSFNVSATMMPETNDAIQYDPFDIDRDFIVDHTITNAFVAGNVRAISSNDLPYAGGMIGSVSPMLHYNPAGLEAPYNVVDLNLGDVEITNVYLDGDSTAVGGIYQGSIVGFSSVDPTLSGVYIDYEMLSGNRFAIGNWATAANPSNTDPYHAGATNLKTIQMTGDGTGIPSQPGLQVNVHGLGPYLLTEDRADVNMSFLWTTTDIWIAVPDSLGSIHLFYPRFAWAPNAGPAYIADAAVPTPAPTPAPGGGGDRPSGGGNNNDNRPRAASNVCAYPIPGEPAPFIYRATSDREGSLTLHFETGGEPFNRYMLEYGYFGRGFTFGAM
ncbi:MAG: hypothetical protein LBG64_00565, partial [Pseudomonadales bacterium]|nr:hypothetical protein [Pseudomonadales bacterium]